MFEKILLRWRLARLVASQRGASSFGAVGGIIGIVIAVYVMANTLPEAIIQLSNETAYAGAPTAVTAIATVVLSILVVFACAMYLLPEEVKSKVGL